MGWADCLMLAALGTALLVAPHRRKPATASARTLVGAARDVLRESLGQGTARAHAIRAVALLGCGAVLLPAACLAVVLVVPPDAARLALFGAGSLLVLATAANVLVIAICHANFGFGGGTTRDATPFAWLIPAFVAGCALLALVAAAWGPAARWLLGG